MGGGRWDDGLYSTAARTRVAKGIDDFDYDRKVRAGIISGINADLDPALIKNGIRESRDSDEHPESLPISVFFDVTGSMGGIPRMLQKKLAELMDVIIDKAGVQHPQVLVGAIGDAYVDEYPFQVGQFESDNRFDEQLRNIILEGGGGGQVQESYGLAYYFAANHMITDSFEKRGKKGYLFTMGDEMPWQKITVREAKDIFKDQLKKDQSLEDILALVQEKWEVYHLFCLDGSYPDRMDIRERWRKLLNERFVLLKDSKLVCEVIAGLIYGNEAALDADAVVKSMGLKGKDRDAVVTALTPLVKSGKGRGVAKGNLPATAGIGKGDIIRL